MAQRPSALSEASAASVEVAACVFALVSVVERVLVFEALAGQKQSSLRWDRFSHALQDAFLRVFLAPVSQPFHPCVCPCLCLCLCVCLDLLRPSHLVRLFRVRQLCVSFVVSAARAAASASASVSVSAAMQLSKRLVMVMVNARVLSPSP